VILAGIFMSKLEKEVVYPTNPILFKRYVDDIFNRKKKTVADTLLPKLNAYHKNIKFTVERNLTKFLDTKLHLENGNYKTSVNRNRKLPMHWSSKVPKKLKRNIINNDLHRADKIGTDFRYEINNIKEKYKYADYPLRFTESVIKDYEDKKTKPKVTSEQKSKSFVPIKVPFCSKNERIAKHFLKKLKEYTNENFTFMIIWQSRKIKTLFPLKDKIIYKANVIYKGTDTTDPNTSYIGETKLIAEKRWEQHEDPSHDSAPSKYLTKNPQKVFDWEILSMSFTEINKRKIHEAIFIIKQNPPLNKHVKYKKLILFKNGVT